MDRTGLDNIFPQTGYCGIWCGSCAVGASAIQQLARSYRELCEVHGLAHWGATGFDYETFLRALDSIAALPGCSGCLQSGGRDDCDMRSCAQSRELRGCMFCDGFDTCPHAAVREHMRDGARKADLLVATYPEAHDLSAQERQRHLVSLWWWRALFGVHE